MKKIASILLILVCLSFTANAESTVIKKGDYVSLGRYNGESIVWRAVDETDGEIVLMAEDVVALSSFDSSTSRFGTSSLREWLNSSSGFLSPQNFTEGELAILKPAAYTAALNDTYASQAVQGSAVHIYGSARDNFIKNYGSAFVDSLSDKIFIPSVADIHAINSNPAVFGASAAIASPTVGVCESLNESGNGIKQGGGWYYWLRDALFGADGYARCVLPEGIVSYQKTNEASVGVRPMCCADKSLLGISGGKGTKSEPYTLSDVSYIALFADSGYGIAENDVSIFVSTNSADIGTVNIYRNGTLAAEDVSGSCKIELLPEENVFTAQVVKSDGNVLLTSEPLVLYGLSYNVIATTASYDFNEKQIYSNCEWVDDDAEHGKAIVLASPPRTNMQIGVGHFLTKKPCAYVDVDLRFDTMSSGEKIPFYIMVQPVGQFIKPIIIDKNGYLRINDAASSASMKLEEGKWYNFKIIVDDEQNTLTVAVDNVVLCKDAKIAVEFEYTQRMNISNLNYASSIENRMAIDNLVAVSADKYTAELVLRLYEVSGGDTQIVIINNLSEHIDGDLVLCAYDTAADAVNGALITPVSLDSGAMLNTTLKTSAIKNENTRLKGVILKDFLSLVPIGKGAEEY